MKLYKGKKLILRNLVTAAGFLERFIGLLGKNSVPDDFAMYFPDCNSIHTYFMKIPIDVIMLDVNGRVVFISGNLAPWKTAVYLKAKDTIEMGAGTAQRLKIKMGDDLRVFL